MADVAQVQQLLRHLKSTVTQTPTGDFVVLYNRREYALDNADVDKYIAAKASITRPVPTAIHFPAWFEQAVEVQRHGPMFLGASREKSEIKLENSQKSRSVTLSPASTTFTLAQLDTEQMPLHLRLTLASRSMTSWRTPRDNNAQPPPFRDIFERILTIKVATAPGDVIAKDSHKLRSIAEASLFHIAYGKGVGLSLSLRWERVSYRLVSRRDSVIQFPAM